MARFRRIRRQTMGKQMLKHSGTLLANIGNASVPTKFIICETEGGARTTTGAEQVIQANRTTDEVCQVGDIVKYVNIIIQCGPRTAAIPESGWLEWAVVAKREADADIPTTQTGNETIGVIAQRMYRNEVIFTGVFPMSNTQPNSQQIMLKIPKSKVRLNLGDTICIFAYFRSVVSTDMQTDSNRLVMSYIYKSYG